MKIVIKEVIRKYTVVYGDSDMVDTILSHVEVDYVLHMGEESIPHVSGITERDTKKPLDELNDNDIRAILANKLIG